MLFSRLQSFTIVAETSAATGTLRCAIIKNVFAGPLIMTDNIRFAAGALHFIQRPQFLRIRFQLLLDLGPVKTLVAINVFLKTRLQCFEEFFPLFCRQLLFAFDGCRALTHDVSFRFFRCRARTINHIFHTMNSAAWLRTAVPIPRRRYAPSHKAVPITAKIAPEYIQYPARMITGANTS